MNFDKAKTLRKLVTFIDKLQDIKETHEWEWLMTDADSETEDMDREAKIDQVKNDIMFVRGLMDDIECDRITEFPLVEKTNFMTGKTFLEEPDLPYFCSPSSETFWSS